MTQAPVSERGYARQELLAETGWLAQHLDDPDVRVIDTRAAQLYEAGHIPGAVSSTATGSVPRAANGDMGDPDEFARFASALGAGNDTTVVIYDAPGAAMGALAWAFIYYGHDKVRVLDGGFAKWTAEARPVSTEPAAYPAARFEAGLLEELCCSLEDAKATHAGQSRVFWDVRTTAEYEGTAPSNLDPARLGHIPGAIHLDWQELLDAESRTLKPAAELARMLGERGITPESEINCY